MLAIVLLARGGLRVEMGDHWFNLAELPGELSGAFASVLVRSVTTRSPVLAHMVGTVVNIGGAVLTNKP